VTELKTVERFHRVCGVAIAFVVVYAADTTLLVWACTQWLRLGDTVFGGGGAPIYIPLFLLFYGPMCAAALISARVCYRRSMFLYVVCLAVALIVIHSCQMAYFIWSINMFVQYALFAGIMGLSWYCVLQAPVQENGGEVEKADR
jgi:hypothetical protein